MHTAKKTKKELQKVKVRFEQKLAENIRGDTKSFFAYVRENTKARVLTGPLEDMNRNIVDGIKIWPRFSMIILSRCSQMKLEAVCLTFRRLMKVLN